MSPKQPTDAATPDGIPLSAEELLPQLYTELRRLAAAKLANERPGQTLQATALVHEAWLRLNPATGRPWASRAQFFAAAAEAMRRILIDNARRKRRPINGGDLERVEIDDLPIASPVPDDLLLAVNEALDELATVNPRAAEVVKLRFFAGLTEAEIAAQLGISHATVERTWAFARAWLFAAVRREIDPPPTTMRDSPP
jgi:RNA polymerase sigma factor (TIGR02999 family)